MMRLQLSYLFGLIVIVAVCTHAVRGYAQPASSESSPEKVTNAALEQPAWMRPPPYHYDPANKADPFVPFIRKEEPAVLQPEESLPDRPLTPLEQIEVTHLRLIGVLWYPQGGEETKAMLQLPDGKGVIVQKATRVGKHKGVVIEITPEAVIVREQGQDILGNRISRDVRMQLHNNQGAQHD
ncbi:MAG: hypothetical protein CSA21_04965 [Deltaproteobacteria bacterium]|nr:MAG: hypothetical protein CSA21_04965 [Deltaproteobacteria bacterium]